jgi:hypothetical protein
VSRDRLTGGLTRARAVSEEREVKVDGVEAAVETMYHRLNLSTRYLQKCDASEIYIR